MRVRNLSRKTLLMVAVCVVGLIIIVGFAVKVSSVVQRERVIFENKRIEYVRQLELLVGKGGQAEEVVRLLGPESKLSSAEARKAIQQHAPNEADIANSLVKADRWPSASFFTDGDFTFVVFFDSDGRIRDFVIGNQ